MINNVDLVEYILALSEGTIDNNIINNIKNTEKTLKDAMYIFDSILTIEKEKILNQISDIDTELNFIKTKYKNLGLNSVINIKFFNSILTIYLATYIITGFNSNQKIELISTALDEIETCENKDIKNGIYKVCLQYITKNNLILTNKILTRKILDYCKTIDSDKNYVNILPGAFLSL